VACGLHSRGHRLLPRVTFPPFFDRLRHPWMQALVTAAVYAAATWVGIRLLRTPETIGVIWPATGVLVGAVLAWRDTRPWLLGAACWLAAASLQIALGVSPLVAVMLSALGAGEALLIAWLLPRWHHDIRQLAGVSSIFVLAGVAAIGAALVGIAGTLIITTYWPAYVLDVWVVWTWGHTLGVMLYAPPWLAWSQRTPARPSRSTARTVEATLATVALLAIAVLVFFEGLDGLPKSRFLSLPYQILPITVWIAIRFGTRGTSLAMAAVSIVAVWGASIDGGAFRLTHPALTERVLVTQGYVLSITMGCMALAIAMERAHAQELQTRLLNVSLAEANAVLMHEMGERERTALSLRMLLDATPEGILVIGTDGRIVEVNAALERMLGYSRLQLLGLESDALIAPVHRNAVLAWQTRFLSPTGPGQALRTHHDLVARRSDGSTFEAQVGLNPYHLGDQLRVIATVRDVTDERAVERRMETSLREKEVLLREVHHRVKNNMAVMSSLFYLQSRHATDPHTVRVFRDSESRVRSMAMVHEVLYRSEDLSAVDFGRYLETLVDHLANVYRGTVTGLHVERDIQPIRLSIDQAVPCGLLLNEVLTNVLKHAFVDGGSAALQVRAWSRADQVCIDVLDNGVGMPDDVSPASTQTLGVRLMQALIEQLEGSLVHHRQVRGTRTAIRFPLVVGATTIDAMPVVTSA
jgi:PAS domain S-box-containing protein